MNNIPVYKSEIQDGIDTKIKSLAKIVFYGKAEIAKEPAQLAKAMKRPLQTLKVKTLAENEAGPEQEPDDQDDLKQEDLEYLDSIMVSSSWNLNDDVFLKEELWVARNTPVGKPLNYCHIESDIIGHIMGCKSVTAEMQEIDQSKITSVEDLPDLFHIVDQCVLYKRWADSSLQERMDNILAEIPQGLWSVSMEAWFNNFDYCLMSPTEGCKVIARNEKTAFLSKYLRWYGGSGQYKDSKIGRVLRGISFCGKGLVRDPANPYSAFVKTSAKMVYDELSDKTELNTMANENEKNEVEKLKLELDEKNKQIAKIEAESKFKARSENLVSALGLGTDKASALATSLCALGDEDFASTVVSVKELLDSTCASLKTEVETVKASSLKVVDEIKNVVESTKKSLADEISTAVVELIKPIFTETFNKGSIPPEANPIVTGGKTEAEKALENAGKTSEETPPNVKPEDESSKALSSCYENVYFKKNKKV